MTIQIHPHQIVTILGAVFSCMVLLAGWPRRKATGGFFFIAFTLSVTFWLITSTIESMVVDQSTKILWSQILYFGFTQAYPYLFLFIISYTQQRRIPLPFILSLMVIPVLTMIVAWTNAYHGWLWSGYTQGSIENNILIYHHGYWYWVYVAYLYILLAVGFSYLLVSIKNAAPIFRRQLLLVMAGLFFPILTGTIYVLGIEPVRGMDITPTGLVFTGIFFAWGLFKYQMLDLLPVARTALVEQIQAGVIVLDLKGRIVDTNRASQTLFGWNPKTIIGEEIGHLSPPLAELVAQAGDQNHSEISITTPGPATRVMEAQSSILFSDKQDIIGNLIILFDITERKQTEEALKMSESKIRAITDSAQDAIVMIDPAGNVSFWNPAAERILGYTSAEAMGMNLFNTIVPEEYRANSNEDFQEFQRTGRTNVIGKSQELEAMRKGGKQIPIQLSLSSLYLNRGWYAVSIISDITERKIAEQKLQETIAQLEESITTAKALAVQADLANVAKSEFLANMSHEIRTPMNGVIGMTGLLLETDLDDEQRRYTEIVRSSGESLLSLINDILDFSKIEAGKLELETLDFDLLSLLDDFAAAMAVRAHEKGLELLCAADPKVPTLLQGDPGRLRQILTNLVGNAIKFTHQGEVSIRVFCLDETDGEVGLRFAIRDTGIGIPAEKKSLLFDKFTQLDSSTTRQFGGSGLGLAISKQLVGMMGGEIDLRSIPEQGSEFWFTVRLGLQPGGGLGEILPLPNLNGLRILVVDDNATSREILNIRLAAWGMRPADAGDGAAALRKLTAAFEEGDPFRLAILDMQMPAMDGAALGKAIKADPHLADTLLVLLSSLGERGDSRRFKKIGFSGYLVKPLRHTDLFNVLSAVLAARGGNSTADPLQPEAPQIMTRHAAREIRQKWAGQGARILLVEDNITNQQVALGILRNYQLHVDAVASGIEALQALENIPYDLVLMDIQMPEMDGLEATQHIRNQRSAVLNHNIPIIAMTAHALQGDRERFIEAGMNDYISKPVKVQVLAAILERWLADKPLGMPSRPAGPPPSADIDAHREPSRLYDPSVLAENLLGNDEKVRAIISAFLEEVPRQIQALKDSLASGDVAGVRRLAHTIKGSAAIIGAEPLHEIAAEMEKMSHAGDLSAIRERMGGLQFEFNRLEQALLDAFEGTDSRPAA